MLDQKNSWYYSVETPTVLKFRFKGKIRKLAARTDMTLYTKDEERLVDIEFKQGNSPAPDIDKEIRKLLKEGRDGIWFHLLKNTDHRTFSLLFKRIRESLDQRIEESLNQRAENADVNRRALAFAICVLAPEDPSLGVMYQGLIELGDSNWKEKIARLFVENESMPRREDGWTEHRRVGV
jgi:hypothetical protein